MQTEPKQIQKQSESLKSEFDTNGLQKVVPALSLTKLVMTKTCEPCGTTLDKIGNDQEAPVMFELCEPLFKLLLTFMIKIAKLYGLPKCYGSKLFKILLESSVITEIRFCDKKAK